MLKIVILLALFIQYSEAEAKDFGIMGEVYEIKEQSLLEYIKQKLNLLKASGELELKQNEMKEKVRNYVNRPYKVKGIVTTAEPREYYYDPTYTVANDIKDQDGRVFIEAGRKVNPLETMPLSYRMLFIDGDDEEQVRWGIEQAKKDKVKIILINGAIIDLMKENKVRFYFDQQGVLSKKFGIKQVPASVEQKDLQLLIKELVAK
jgi:conjugal transfer pilus assembly protein TraW